MSQRVRATNRLSAVKVAKAKAPGFLEDGAGLRLLIDQKLNKRWVLRITVQGNRRDFGLGKVADVSLDEARQGAAAMRKAASEGKDPLAVVAVDRFLKHETHSIVSRASLTSAELQL